MRARNIKPGFFENPELSECSAYARLLFIGLWGIADWTGTLENRPRKIKGQLFPFENIDTKPLIDELIAQGFVIPYTGGDQALLYLPTFSTHQSPHKKEKEKPSKFVRYSSQTNQQDRLSMGPSHESSEQDQEIPEPTALIADCGNLNPDCGNLIEETQWPKPLSDFLNKQQLTDWHSETFWPIYAKGCRTSNGDPGPVEESLEWLVNVKSKNQEELDQIIRWLKDKTIADKKANSHGAFVAAWPYAKRFWGECRWENTISTHISSKEAPVRCGFGTNCKLPGHPDHGYCLWHNAVSKKGISNSPEGFVIYTLKKINRYPVQHDWRRVGGRESIDTAIEVHKQNNQMESIS